MKRILIFLALIFTIFAFASCDIGDTGDTSSTDKKSESNIKMHAHVFDELGYDDKGHHEKCSVAGCDKRKDFVPHTFGEEWVVAVENTHSTDGIKEKKCTVCEYRLEEKIPAGHNFEEFPYIASTCISDGRASHVVCKECGDAFKDTTMEVPFDLERVTIERKPHTFENAIVNFIAPTFEADGKIEIKCSACNTAPNAYNTIPLPNTFDSEYYSWSTKTEAGCEQNGKITYEINRSKVINRLTYTVGSDFKDELSALTEQTHLRHKLSQLKPQGTTLQAFLYIVRSSIPRASLQ